MISVKVSGNFNKTMKFLEFLKKREFYKKLDIYGEQGVDMLRLYTPKRTGRTSESWHYRVEINEDSASLIFYNTNLAENGTPIAILIQYGHMMPSGYYVQGRDYINPALQKVFDDAAEGIWKEVVNA